MVVRICVGLPSAVADLDDDAAQRMREHIDGVNSALGLLSDAYGGPGGLGWALITVFAVFIVAGGLFAFAAVRRSEPLPEIGGTVETAGLH